MEINTIYGVINELDGERHLINICTNKTSANAIVKEIKSNFLKYNGKYNTYMKEEIEIGIYVEEITIDPNYDVIYDMYQQIPTLDLTYNYDLLED